MPRPGPAPAPCLYCLRGPVEARERTWLLPAGESTLGSSEANDLVLPVHGVSRQHAQLRVDGEGVELTDLASTNGSFVNGERVERAPVALGDELRFGPVILKLQEIDPDDARLAFEIPPPPRTSRAGLPDDPSTDRLVDRPPRRARGGSRGIQRFLRFPPDCVVGAAPAINRLHGEIRALCRGDLPVLITGETGVGKEHVAKTLHLSSARARGPFLAMNCAAIPADLLEAEMFGVTEGAATGVRAREGRFAQARGGTLFLDELGDMSLPLQAKLLRAVQEKEIQPVGGRPFAVDVRIVAATNKDLQAEAAAGRFRSDLYYRVAGAVLTVPPLRERREDIPGLVESFLRAAAKAVGKNVRGLTVKALDALVAHPWPGNVRELEHEVHRLVQVCPEGQAIDSTMLPARFAAAALPERAAEPEDALRLERHVLDLERRLILQALDETGGSQRRAAVVLGISRNALARKMRRLGLAE